MKLVDLRSDTVTRPGLAMRAAMAAAEVGDDVYGEDPSVRALEERAAALLGKEAAVFVPSGTMSNQIALLVHTQKGDEVIIGEGAHVAWYESGAGAAWAGVQFAVAGRGGLFDGSDVADAIKPRADYSPRTSLVALENTHNRGGGRVFSEAATADIARVARAHGLALHLDGARIWNAACATSRTPAELAAPFDTVSACFSKGLGAPVGSCLASTVPIVRAARRFRKMLGGGMRQAGILAAGALWALEHNVTRLTEDHAAARRFAELLEQAPKLCVRTPVETNIVVFDCESGRAEALASALRSRGILLNAISPSALRAVTHLDVTLSDVEHAARVVIDAGGSAPA